MPITYEPENPSLPRSIRKLSYGAYEFGEIFHYIGKRFNMDTSAVRQAILDQFIGKEIMLGKVYYINMYSIKVDDPVRQMLATWAIDTEMYLPIAFEVPPDESLVPAQ